MNKLEKILSGWNFKKIAVWYLILAAAAGLACVGTVGFIYRERLNFAWQYSRLEEAKDDAALKAAADKTAAASADVVDVLVLTAGNAVCTDCTVLEGRSEVNESILTGESESVIKRQGDRLLSGSSIIAGWCLAQAE